MYVPFDCDDDRLINVERSCNRSLLLQVIKPSFAGSKSAHSQIYMNVARKFPSSIHIGFLLVTFHPC